MLANHNLTNHVNFPTHDKGNALDLLITPTGSSPASISCLPDTPSDHFAVLTVFDTPRPTAPQPSPFAVPILSIFLTSYMICLNPP